MKVKFKVHRWSADESKDWFFEISPEECTFDIKKFIWSCEDLYEHKENGTNPLFKIMANHIVISVVGVEDE